MNFKKRVNGSWVDTPHYIMGTDTDTITTLPADLYADGNNATVGLKGNMYQASGVSPDNPIMPQGTGERTGNLYNINAKDVNNGYVDNAQLNQDGTTETWESAEISEYIPINGDTAYTFNGIGSYNSPCYGLYDENKQLIGAHRYNGAQIIKFTSPNNARYFRFTHIKIATQAMTVEGTYTSSTMPEFEPYGIKIPISNGQQTTNIYLGSTQTVRQIYKYVCTGEENWNNNFGVSLFGVQNMLNSHPFIPRVQAYCTHCVYNPVQSGIDANTHNGDIVLQQSGGSGYNVFIKNTDYTTNEDFKAWLATEYANGTPVTIWYVLATPETAAVNEPLRKIGDYADTVSGITIPTTAGANTISIGTTLQPSEVSVNYKGWHPVTDVHEYDSNYTIATMQALTIAQLQTHTISELQGEEWS